MRVKLLSNRAKLLNIESDLPAIFGGAIHRCLAALSVDIREGEQAGVL